MPFSPFYSHDEFSFLWLSAVNAAVLLTLCAAAGQSRGWVAQSVNEVSQLPTAAASMQSWAVTSSQGFL